MTLFDRALISVCSFIAYRYGVTTVPFSEEDKKNMKFTNVGKCMKALGFAPASQVKAHLFVGDDVKIMTAALADEAAATAVSALVHALKEDNMVIICRYGYNRISAPKMVALSPHICQRAAGNYEVRSSFSAFSITDRLCCVFFYRVSTFITCRSKTIFAFTHSHLSLTTSARFTCSLTRNNWKR